MDNTIYNLTASQVGAFNNVTTIANNVANANTQGYKADNMVFERYLTKDVHDNNTMPQDRATIIDTKAGTMKVTGRQLDFAVSGDAFFMIQTPLGVRYTRNGSFTVNNNYEVVTADGKNLLTQNGDIITLDQSDGDIMVNAAGVVFARNTPQENYQERATIGIASFPDLRILRKAGDGYLMVEDDQDIAEIADPANYKVLQGVVEESNVIPINEITRLIDVQRYNENVSSTMRGVRAMRKNACHAIAKQQ
jgi:flagellar basal-body rod protein FlgF